MDTLVERPYAIDLSRLMKFNPRSLTWLPCLMIIAVVIRITINISVLEWQAVSYVALFFSMLSFFIMAYLYLREGVMSHYVMACVLFVTLMLMSTIIGGNDIKNCFYDGCSYIFVVMVCEYYSGRLNLIVASFAISFSLCAYLNAAHMMLHPELWFANDTVVNGYLLGANYNQMGCRLLCAVAASVLCLKYNKWWWVNVVPIVLVSLATLFIVGSMTSITGILLFLLFCIIPSKRLIKIGVLALLAGVILFQIFVCFQGKGIEQNELAIFFVEDILGKDITFTNRTYLWDAASKVFVESPIYGYGYVGGDWYLSHLSSLAKGPHNFIWLILIYGGVLLLMLFSYMCYIVIPKLVFVNDKYILLVYASVAILFMMMTMEAYSPVFIITLMSIAYYAAIKSPKGSDVIQQ